MIGFIFACCLIVAYAGGCWSGWFARAYLDRRTRHYFRRGQKQHADRSALSLDDEPLLVINRPRAIKPLESTDDVVSF